MKKLVAIVFVNGCLVDAQAQKEDCILVKLWADDIVMTSSAYENCEY